MPCAPENKKADPLPVKGSRPASAVRAVCRCQPAEPPAGLFACLSLTRLCYKSVMTSIADDEDATNHDLMIALQGVSIWLIAILCVLLLILWRLW
jgi:hypothetical protein